MKRFSCTNISENTLNSLYWFDWDTPAYQIKVRYINGSYQVFLVSDLTVED